MSGFAAPKTFRGTGDIRALLESNWRYLTAYLNSQGTGWESFTPALTASTTNPSGYTSSGRYKVDRGLVVYRFYFQFNSSGVSAGSGEYRIEAPVPISAASPSNAYVGVGQATLFDWSVAGHKELANVHTGSSPDYFVMYVKNATVWHNNPMTWAANDRFGGQVIYQEA